MNEFYDRIVKPLSIPLLAGVFVFVLVYAFSRILLAVPEIGSTTLAILLAAEILGVCAVLAAARKINAAQKMLTVLLGVGLIAGGGVAAGIGEREFEGHGGGELSVAALNIEFLETELHVPADDPFELAFANEDPGVPHNVAVYADESASESLFVGEIFNGVSTMVYEIPAIPAGSYFFRCDVHPQMTGTMIAGEGGPAPSPTGTGGPAPTEVEITASGIQFDLQEFTLAADTQTTIAFDNQDASVPHNVAIYPSRDQTTAEQALFQGEIFNGVETREYSVPPIPAGSYYFRCDVHPNMEGTAIFR